MRSGDFSIIPVVDLQDGCVVRARAGDRSAYAPIVTPLAPSADPAAVVSGLLRAWPAREMYIADLNAIQGRGSHSRAVRDLCDGFPAVTFWVDGGFADAESVAAYALPRTARVVIGTESQRDEGFARAAGTGAILSLDSRGDERVGPARLHDEPDHWPGTVIAMTLSRVGVGAGPDMAHLGALVAKAGGRRVIAAGGVRDLSDCEALARIGVAGALVATALHDGRIRA